jgi:hypothetical protein
MPICFKIGVFYLTNFNHIIVECQYKLINFVIVKIILDESHAEQLDTK